MWHSYLSRNFPELSNAPLSNPALRSSRNTPNHSKRPVDNAMITLSLDAPEEELHVALRELRLSIIGDEDEKMALLHSPNLEVLFTLAEQCVSGQSTGSTTLEHILIILYSLSVLPESLPKLINQFGLFVVLLRIANRYKDDDGILINVVNIFSNVLSTRKDHSLDLNSADGLLFHDLIFDKLSDESGNDRNWVIKQNRVLSSIFKLIPHLNPMDLKSLIQPTLRILDMVLYGPFNSLFETCGNKKIYTECFDQVFVPSPPKMILFANFTAPLLFSLAHMLYQCPDPLMKSSDVGSISGSIKIDGVLDKNHYFVMSSLLKAQDPELKLAAINVIVEFSQNSDLSDIQKSCNVVKILPYLIQLINLEDFNNLHVYKSDLKLSRKFNPLYILSNLSLHFEFVNDFLLNCNIIDKFVDVVNKLEKMSFESISLSKMDNLCYVFLILSTLTSTKESNRNEILSNELTNSIEKVLEYHLIHLHRFMDNGDINEDLLLTLNHLAIGACYLLRSFSRSISTLRTHLNERQTIKYMLEIISIPEDKLTECCMNRGVLLHAELLLKTVTLTIVSNVVLDFSPLRKSLLQGGLVDIIADLLHHTEHTSILVNSLWVLRHIIYNEKVEARERYLKPIGLGKIVEFCNHEDVKIQEMSFNVLRNLTTNSKVHVMQLLHFFDTDEEDDDDDKRQRWLNFLKMKLDSHVMFDKSNESILETIIYVIVHIGTIDEECRDLIVKNEVLMVKIRELMSGCPSASVKMACIWVVINLTWAENIQRSGESPSFGSRYNMEVEDTSDVRDYEGDVIADQRGGHRLRDLRTLRSQSSSSQGELVSAPARVVKLCELGFPQALSEVLNNVDNLDLKERVKVALSNFGARA